MSAIKYYSNDEKQGIIFNWVDVARELDKLQIPKGYFEPLQAIINGNGARWNVAASVRSVGKTTAVLLLGMVLNKLYGTQIAYIRNTVNECKQMNSADLFGTICGYKNGRYIEICTNGYYNSIYYRWKKIYYCRRDDDGNVLEKSNIPLVYVMACDEHEDKKSTFNVPLCDLLIWDECITAHYDNYFFKFSDLQKTIGRDRKSLYMFLLCNTTNITAPLWRELEIAEQVRTIRTGHGRLCTASKGQKIYVEMCDVKLKVERTEYNELYFGFDNTKLDAITGNNTGWSFDCVPHIIRDDDKKVINRDISISYHGELLGVDIMYSPRFHSFLEVHPISKRRKIIFVLDDIIDHTEFHGMPRTLWRTLQMFKDRNLIFYTDNLSGHLYTEFMNECAVV